jgi:ribosomal protein S18 acetylase RimI-like enzyme
VSLTIAAARADERTPALHLFFADLDAQERENQVQRVLGLLARGELSTEDLLVCRDGPEIVGVMMGVALAGAAGLVWPPVALPRSDALTIEDRLIHCATLGLRQRGCKFAQALLGGPDRLSCLERHGFRDITTLLYLESAVAGHDRDDKPQRLRFEHYQFSPALFHTTLLRSYEDSLDCPELNHVRGVEEILAGYRAAGAGQPEHWWLAFYQGRPAGVVIAVAQPSTTWELAYVGLVPEMRGQGLGAELTVKALREACSAGAERMTLTVDVRNGPARRMYASLGFEEFDQRRVFLSLFDKA